MIRTSHSRSGLIRLGLSALLLVFLLDWTSVDLMGQDSTQPTPAAARIGKPAKIIETQITVELLTGPEGVSFRAQSWSKLMQELDVPLRIRRGFGDEQKTGTTEKMIGTSLREVHVTGFLEPNGDVNVGNHHFREGETAKFKEWIKELKTYGVQGAPQGQPLWGLTRKQFEEVYAALETPVESNLAGTRIVDISRNLKLPETYPVVIDESARNVLAAHPDATIRTEVSGFSHGIALAIVLKEAGLGFFPRRTPEGPIEIAVASLEERPDTWPIGWPPQGETFQTVPELSKVTSLEARDQPLTDFMQQIQELGQIPILYDWFALQRDNIQLEGLTINILPKRISWISALRAVLFKHRMRPEILSDEAGKPFLWITSEKLRSSIVIPKE